MINSDWLFAMNRISSDFLRASYSRLDEWTGAAVIKIGVEVMKKVTGSGEIFWARSNRYRGEHYITREGLWRRLKRKMMELTKADVITSTSGVSSNGRCLESMACKCETRASRSLSSSGGRAERGASSPKLSKNTPSIAPAEAPVEERRGRCSLKGNDDRIHRSLVLIKDQL